MSRDDVRAAYIDGVAAVADVVADFGERDWSAPACGTWTAADTVRHLLTVARWYGQWLDRALAGDVTPPFPGRQIDAYAAAALDEVGGLDPTDAVAEFQTTAMTYLERAERHWDLPEAYPFGVVTVGLHLGVAAAEWHLHAWDLSGVRGDRHRPDRPDVLLIAAGECVAAASGGARGAVVRRLVPLAARRSPWESLLKRTGRSA